MEDSGRKGNAASGNDGLAAETHQDFAPSGGTDGIRKTQNDTVREDANRPANVLL